MNRLQCGFKFADTTDDGTFSGYGSVFGNTDSYGDVVAKGAFKQTLKEAKSSDNWPPMLLQHGGMGFGSAEDMMPVGIWTDLSEDDQGLRAEGKLALDTRRGAEVYALMKMQPRPAINGMSIGYRAKEFALGTKPSEPKRTLKAVELKELSIVTFPANGKALIDSVKGELPTEREFEQWLVRDAGLTRSQAKAIISSGFKALKGTRDAAPGEDVVESLQRFAAMLRA